MSEGVQRSDVPYVWPQKIVQPQRPPSLVYLDLNHWINLSKCMSGHSEGARYSEAMEACLNARRVGTAVFPISDSTYIEISKIREYRRRVNLGKVIEELCQYRVVIPRTIISRLEIEAVFEARLGPSGTAVGAIDYLGWGVARAFGRVGGFQIVDESDRNITTRTTATHQKEKDNLMSLLESAELLLNQRIIDGPSPEDEPRMRELGWRPEAAIEIADQRADQEIEQAGRFDQDSRWRRGRTRDVIAVREIEIELGTALSDELCKREETFQSVFPSREEARAAFNSMPSFDTSVTLKTSYHRNSGHSWTRNDIHDIDALASTLPYCDIVVTDKAMADHANRSGLAGRLNTKVFSSLTDLTVSLERISNS